LNEDYDDDDQMATEEGGREEEEEEACQHTRLFIHYPDTQYARIS
jgi:hypothetical protein